MPEQKIELERIYTVPLSRAWITARHKRTRRAVKILREFAEKHMKSEEIKIDTELNERLWNRGITRPPRKITVKMEKDEDGVVTISLPKEKEEPKPELEIEKEELPEQATEVEKKEAEPVKEETPHEETPKTEATPKKETPRKGAAKKATKKPAKKKTTTKAKPKK